MKRLLTLFLGALWLLLAGSFDASAQTIDAFRQRLASSEGGATVEVVEHDGAATVVAQADRGGERLRINGYRIGIFFDNKAGARERAMEARNTFSEAFPDVKVYMVYENPYFKVTAGNCLTSEEAIVLMGRIRTLFPEAYLMRESLTITDFLR